MLYIINTLRCLLACWVGGGGVLLKMCVLQHLAILGGEIDSLGFPRPPPRRNRRH